MVYTCVCGYVNVWWPQLIHDGFFKVCGLIEFPHQFSKVVPFLLTWVKLAHK